MPYQISDSVDIPHLQQIVNALQAEIDERERATAALASRNAELYGELQRRLAELEPAPEALTAREMVVLRLIAQGLSNQEIAERIMVSAPTMRAHVSHILGRLHLASRTQAALYAVLEGLTDADGAQEE